MIPIRDANPTRRMPWITIGIIAANLVIFLLWQPTFRSQEAQQAFFFCHAMIPYEVTHQTNLAEGGLAARRAIDAQAIGVSGAALQDFLGRRCPGKSWPASVLVAMFLHGGWFHLLGNMLFLWIFGNNIEDRLGRFWYPLFYLAGGLAAFELQLAFDRNSVIPALGASGAIAAVLGAYIVLYPRARVTTLVIFFLITAIELPAVVVLGFWFVLQLFSGVGGLGTDVNGGVAYWAHVGGFAFGAAVAYLLLRGGTEHRTREYVPPRPDV